VVADDERLVACLGAVPVRLLSERMWLTGGLSAAMRRQGFQPVGDVLGIDPRPGNATSNCAADNIKLLEAAVTALPGRYRHRMLVRVDGAGVTHSLPRAGDPLHERSHHS
jgi:hypothetical protein